MKLKITLLFVAIVLSLCMQQTFLMSNSTAPPSGHTGANGTTCATAGCHTPGVGVGNLSYTIKYHGNGNAVNSYFPNNVYDITVKITGTGNATPKFGFEMRAEDASHNVRGAFTILNSSITGFPTGGEIGHVNATTTDSVWAFQWTAPPSLVGNINFYLAGNYANGDGFSTGDDIMTTSFTLKPAPITSPTANFSLSRDTVCINVPITATDLHTGGPIKVYSMYFGSLPTNFGNTTPPATFTHTYTSPGTYLVTYVVSTDSPMSGQHGTIDTLTKTVYVIPYPDASTYSITTQGCPGGIDTLKILNPVAGVTYTPNFGTSSLIGTAVNGGPYPLQLPNITGQYTYFSTTATGFGCTSPAFKDSLFINNCSPPNANYSILDSFSNVITHTPCKNTAYYIADNSQQGSSAIISWVWNFNVGNSSTPPIPSSATGQGPHKVIFPTNGTFTFSLTVTDLQGQTNTFTHVEGVNPCGPYLFIPRMHPSTTPYQACIGDSIFFSDNSYVPTIQWHWDFGDGTTSNAIGVNHAYTNAATYTVAMAVEDDSTHTWDTVYNTIIVGSAPAASAGRDTLICGGKCVTIGAAPQNSALYSWTSNPVGFTSHNSSSLVCPTVTTTYYLAASNQAATCFAYDTVKVIVDNPPPVVLTASSLSECPNNTDTIYATPDTLAHYAFSFNGGGVIGTPPSAGGPYVVSWSTLSNKTVTCTASTQHGCVSHITPVIVSVHACNPPIAKFYPPNGVCTGATVAFKDSSTGTPTNWFWNFGGGVTPVQSSAQNPIVTFNTAGVHVITLLVSNSGGSTTYTDTVIAYNAPNSNFSYIHNICEGYNTIITYTGNASPAATYTWGFNPAGTVLPPGTGPGPIYVSWGSPGSKHINLFVTEHGCSSIISDSIVNVQINPTAKFTYNILPNTAYVTYINQSSNATSYQWAFGDNSTSVVANPPTHNYIHNGSFTVTLTSTKGYCSNVDTQIVVVSGVTGMENLTPSPYGLIVYHNDISQQLFVKWTADNGLIKNVQLYNMKGELIDELMDTKENSIIFNTANLSAGLYLMTTVYSDGFVETRKWVKQ